MAAKLSYEEVRRLARIWFADARENNGQDEAEVTAPKQEQRNRARFDAFDNSGGGNDRDRDSGN